MSRSSPAPPETPAIGLADLADQVRRISRENEQLFRLLVTGEKRLRGLAKAVWRAQEEERGRLARELHDGLGQILTALKIQLERLAGRAEASDRGLTDELARAAEMAHRALDDARRLSHSLRPQVLDDLGLVPALRWLARSVGESGELEVRVEHAGIEHERLGPEMETLLFRVVQEALTNVLKHSGAGGARVRLELLRGRRRLRLEVADDGRGFDPRAMPEDDRHGLRSMRDRVEVFGGRLRVSSRPGAGATVEVDLPLDPPEAG